MQFDLVLNLKPINLTPNQNPIWLAHFDLVLECFLGYWLRVKITFNTLAWG
jgi:hypothetical protein